MARAESVGTLEGLIRSAFEHMEADFRVALPGKIDSFNSTTRLATVKPMLSRRFFGSSSPIEMPSIQSVPLVEQRTQLAHISLPVTSGDPVLMIFGDRALDNWIGSAGVSPVEPLDVRMHDLTDCFAILGGWPILKPSSVIPPPSGALALQVAPGTKVAIGNGLVDPIIGNVEILNLVDKLLDTVNSHFHIGFAGVPTAPPDPVTLTTLAQIKVLLGLLKV